jgi:hypothetical protein
VKDILSFGARRLWLAALVLLLATTGYLAVRRAQAFGAETGESVAVTSSQRPELPYYDVRLDKTEAAQATLAAARARYGPTADARGQIAAGEAALRSRVSSLKLEYSPDLAQPEVIGTDALRPGLLTAPLANAGAGQKNSETARSFVRQNRRLFGVTEEQAAALKVEADYTNPDGNLSYVILSQRFNGLPVFRGEVSAMITRQGEIARMINNLAPNLEENRLAREGMSAEEAVAAAARYINREAKASELKATKREAQDAKVEFERGQFDWPVTAEKMYFPTEQGVATLAWRVLLWERVAAFYVIVDAHSGALLWRKNIVADQTQPATYSIYNQESPAPLSPGPNSPTAGTQGAIIPRATVTLIGNEAPNTFNNNGWLANGATSTDGNNVEAGIDRDGANGVDAAGKPTSATREFVFSYNPAPGNPAPGEEPLPSAPLSDFQKGSATQLFYLNNIYHDRLYRVGFTEQARNFQGDNFGRGGNGNDRVSAEAQDSSGTNNANFGTPADGGRGRMQMYIFVPSTPDRDGSLDADVVWHEYTHGLSNRLVGNGSGLGLTQSAGMGEGWSDFYARVLASGPEEDVNGIYTTGGWVTHQLRTASPTGNYYFGIRHFPYAVRSNTGPNGRPHNPLTFADIDTAQANITDGAFTSPIAWTATATHANGEVWCSSLLEVRARMITRLGYETGNTRMLQLVTDALKVTPLNPNFIQARDAIIAADRAAFGGADLDDIWNGFATRGMGFGATTNGSSVTESFQLPNLLQDPAFTVSDAPGNNNGVLEPGDNVNLAVPLVNPLSAAASNVTVSVNGGAPVNYGDIAGLQTVTQNIPYTIPGVEPCGGLFTFTLNVTSNRGTFNLTRRVQLGAPVIAQTIDFDSLTAPALPAGWTSAITGASANWVSTTTNPDTGPLSLFTTNPTTPGTAELTSPDFAVTSNRSLLTFRNRYNTEAGFDGGALEISVNGAAFQDIIAAGGQFVSGGYNSVLATGSALAGRSAWNGASGGYITSAVVLPAAANGQNVKFKWRFATDNGTGGAGWNIDTVKFANSYTCAAFASGVISMPEAVSFNEGATLATVMITRQGGIEGTTAGILVSTTDGTARERTDYTSSSGRITLGPNETKAVSISLVDDVYVEGNETFTVQIGQPNGVLIGNSFATTVTIVDNDTTAPTANPSDGAQFFVRQHYLDFLGREPDAAGMTYWTGQIAACGADVVCQRSRRRDVSAAFFVESEFQESGGYVYRLYKAAYGVLPNYQNFTFDRPRILGGASLEQGRQAFAEEFVTREAFTNRYPASQTGTQFIDALLTSVLQSSFIDLSGLRQTLIDDFNANASRARILRLVADSSEFRAAEYNRGFVLMQYFGYLRREIDINGYVFWLNALGARGGNFQGMVCSFITSQEYQQRFSPIFTHTNAECQ